jgi:hypothetical protein
VAAKKRHDLHREPEPAGRLGRFLSERPYLRLLEPFGTEKQYQVSYNNMFGRLSWSASAQRVYARIAPAIVATIAFHSTSATRCGLAKTAPPT